MRKLAGCESASAANAAALCGSIFVSRAPGRTGGLADSCTRVGGISRSGVPRAKARCDRGSSSTGAWGAFGQMFEAGSVREDLESRAAEAMREFDPSAAWLGQMKDGS
jgi:hypothetical protein